MMTMRMMIVMMMKPACAAYWQWQLSLFAILESFLLRRGVENSIFDFADIRR